MCRAHRDDQTFDRCPAGGRIFALMRCRFCEGLVAQGGRAVGMQHAYRWHGCCNNSCVASPCSRKIRAAQRDARKIGRGRPGDDGDAQSAHTRSNSTGLAPSPFLVGRRFEPALKISAGFFSRVASMPSHAHDPLRGAAVLRSASPCHRTEHHAARDQSSSGRSRIRTIVQSPPPSW